MKILILIDKINCAYHSIAKSLLKYSNCDILDMDILPIKAGVNKIKKVYKKYDFFYVMGFQTYEKVDFLPKKITSVGIHSCQAWDNKKTKPGKKIMPDKTVIKFLNGFCRVNAVSKYLYDIFNESGVSDLSYTPNGVDTKIFQPSDRNNHNDFVVGFSGVGNELKGIDKFIIPSINNVKAKPCFAIRKTDKYVPLKEMPTFYNKLDVYVCASSSEGMSLSVLEAASCGVPVVSTRVSGCTEIIEDGQNGFFVDRSVEDISKKISLIKNSVNLKNKMSKNIRNSIIAHHCWSKQIDKWTKFLSGG